MVFGNACPRGAVIVFWAMGFLLFAISMAINGILITGITELQILRIKVMS